MLSSTGGDPREQELMQLQREYRHMELNRRAYAEESNSVLRKQQQNIDKLRKDNEAIKQVMTMSCHARSHATKFDVLYFIIPLGNRIDHAKLQSPGVPTPTGCDSIVE